jgi:hypothetical protein
MLARPSRVGIRINTGGLAAAPHKRAVAPQAAHPQWLAVAAARRARYPSRVARVPAARQCAAMEPAIHIFRRPRLHAFVSARFQVRPEFSQGMTAMSDDGAMLDMCSDAACAACSRFRHSASRFRERSTSKCMGTGCLHPYRCLCDFEAYRARLYVKDAPATHEPELRLGTIAVGRGS